MTIIRYYIMI